VANEFIHMFLLLFLCTFGFAMAGHYILAQVDPALRTIPLAFEHTLYATTGIAKLSIHEAQSEGFCGILYLLVLRVGMMIVVWKAVLAIVITAYKATQKAHDVYLRTIMMDIHLLLFMWNANIWCRKNEAYVSAVELYAILQAMTELTKGKKERSSHDDGDDDDHSSGIDDDDDGGDTKERKGKKDCKNPDRKEYILEADKADKEEPSLGHTPKPTDPMTDGETEHQQLMRLILELQASNQSMKQQLEELCDKAKCKDDTAKDNNKKDEKGKGKGGETAARRARRAKIRRIRRRMIKSAAYQKQI